MSIRLLDNNSNHTPSHQIIDEGCGGYDEYVANYIDWANETKGINQLSLTPRFLKRYLYIYIYIYMSCMELMSS